MTQNECIFCQAITAHGLKLEIAGETPLATSIIVSNAQGRQAIIPDRWGGLVDPTPEALLERVISIVTDYDVCDDFLDWCDEFDLDASNPTELESFKAIGSGLSDLQAMIGAGEVSGLIGGLQIAQAIGNARPR